MGANLQKEDAVTGKKDERNTIRMRHPKRPRLLLFAVELVGVEAWVKGIGSENYFFLPRGV